MSHLESQPAPQVIDLDMGLSLKDIDRTLPLATAPYQLETTAQGYQLSLGDKQVQLDVSPKAPRKIAGLSIPVTKVVMAFSNHSDEDVQAYMAKFKRHFHRGGG